MKKLLLSLILALMTSPAWAVASQETPGYLTTIGCPGGITPCFVPYGPITSVVSAAAEGSHVLKSSAGIFYGGHATSAGTAGYIMVFNATSAPADGAVTPLICVKIAANDTVSVPYILLPAIFSTGITIVFSSTGCFTKTVSSTAFFSMQVR